MSDLDVEISKGLGEIRFSVGAEGEENDVFVDTIPGRFTFRIIYVVVVVIPRYFLRDQ